MVIGQPAPAGASAPGRSPAIPAMPSKHPTDISRAGPPNRTGRTVTWGTPDSEAEAAFERELQFGNPGLPPHSAPLPFAPIQDRLLRERDRHTGDPRPNGEAPVKATTAYPGASHDLARASPSAGVSSREATNTRVAPPVSVADTGSSFAKVAGPVDRPDVTLRITQAGSLIREIVVRRAADGGLDIMIRAANTQSLRQLRAGSAQLKRMFDANGRARVRFALEAC